MSSTDELVELSRELKDLQKERLKRIRAKNDLLTYASIIDIPTRPAVTAEEEIEQFAPIPKSFGAHHLLWLKCLQDVEDGKIQRLMGLLPPGSGKSLYTSVCFPTHFMGRFSNRTVIVTGYGSDLPKKQGRWARSIVRQPLYKRIFGTELSPESAAADEWTLTNGSEWKATGILSGITGNRADGIVWDDLIKGQQDADSKLIRDRTWDEYVNSLRTRKKPGAWEVGINCLTGDTQISMGDGSWKPLSEVRVGDQVLSFKDGKIVKRKVLNWGSQGDDEVIEIRTGGSKVKANARHPFLVMRGISCGSRYWCKPDYSRLEWVKAGDLQIGDVIVTQSSVLEEEKPKTLTESEAWLLGYMFGDGWVTVRDTVQYDKKGRGPYPRRGFMTSVALGVREDENVFLADLFEEVFGIRPKRTKYRTYTTEIANIGRWFIDMGLKGKAKTKRLPNYIFSEPKEIRWAFIEGFVFADGHFTKKGNISVDSCNEELINDLKVLARGLGYRTTNISISNTWRQAPGSPRPTLAKMCNFNFKNETVTTDFIGRSITSVKPVGCEEVFDLQIDDTENFIADGLVNHNTRWHEDDPPGRILPVNYDGQSGWVKGQDGYDWYVVCLPMVCEREDDLLGRNIGGWLWPEYFRQEDYIPLQTNPATTRTWSALYQQRPAPETGNFFEASWFREYGDGTRIPTPHRESLHIYGASDYAVTDEGGNYTVHVVAGVDPEHNIYILDLWRNRTSSDKWVEAFCDLVKKWRPLGWAEETGQIRAGVGPFIHKRLMERGLYIARAQFPTRGDKSVRAQSIRGRMAMGKVYFPVSKPWYAELRREMLTFPAGKNDDQVDAMGLLGQILDKMVSGAPYIEGGEERKILSMDPNVCNVTLDDIFEDNEKRNDRVTLMSRSRIK